jgi:hypothetical protein
MSLAGHIGDRMVNVAILTASDIRNDHDPVSELDAHHSQS